jgi:amino acid transporter
MMFEKETANIKRNAQIGLWGSVGVTILAAAFTFTPWKFYQSVYTAKWMLIVGSVLTVLTVSMSLLVVRKQIPRLRQAPKLETKIIGYAQHIRSLYLSVLTIVVILCLMTVLSSQNVLLMLTMITVLMLFLAYPNIYKMKVDLGLTDEEMKMLFGERYIAETRHED